MKVKPWDSEARLQFQWWIKSECFAQQKHELQNAWIRPRRGTNCLMSSAIYAVTMGKRRNIDVEIQWNETINRLTDGREFRLAIW